MASIEWAGLEAVATSEAADDTLESPSVDIVATVGTAAIEGAIAAVVSAFMSDPHMATATADGSVAKPCEPGAHTGGGVIAPASIDTACEGRHLTPLLLRLSALVRLRQMQCRCIRMRFLMPSSL